MGQLRFEEAAERVMHWGMQRGSGLKVAQVARLLRLSRSAASAQQGLSSKEVVQATHHRLAGRSLGLVLAGHAEVSRSPADHSIPMDDLDRRRQHHPSPHQGRPLR